MNCLAALSAAGMSERSDWETHMLGDLVEKVGSGVTPKGGSESYVDEGVPFIRSQNVLWGQLSLDDVVYITEEQHQRMSNSSLQPLDVLLNITGASIGRCAVLPHDFERGNVNQHVCVIRPKARLSPHYLAHYLLSDLGQDQISKLQAGGNREGLNYQQIRGFSVTCPSRPEQQKIAAILTAVDDKLGVIARQITVTQELKQSLMQALFTMGVGTQAADGRWVPHARFDESPVGRIPACWKLVPLEALATDNISYGVVQPGADVEGGVWLVRGGDIKGGKVARNLRRVSAEISAQFKRTVLQGGELLVSLVGYPGETAVVPGYLKGANIARQAGMIRTESFELSTYIHFYLASPQGKAALLGKTIGSAQQVINLKALREVLVPMPPEAELLHIAGVGTAIASKIDVLEQRLEHYQTLKRGLMQKLLTGEWRISLDDTKT